MAKRKLKKITLHPITSFVLLIVGVILLSFILSLFNVSATYSNINIATGALEKTLVSVNNLLSYDGMKMVISKAATNFISSSPLSTLIITLIGLKIAEKTGLIQAFMKKRIIKINPKTLTFIIILMSIFSSIVNEVGYALLIPLAALLFLFNGRNPLAGIAAAFAGVAFGYSISFFVGSIDIDLIPYTQASARLIDSEFYVRMTSNLFIMIVSSFLIALIATLITEKIIVKKLGRYVAKTRDDLGQTKEIEYLDLQYEEEKKIKEEALQKKGLKSAKIVGIIVIILFVYMIIPGLPLSGMLLDLKQSAYVDQLFGKNSYFQDGFTYMMSIFFGITGIAYGISAKTIKNDKDLFNKLKESLSELGIIIVMIFFASQFIAIFKESNIGTVIAATMANILQSLPFSGAALIIVAIILIAISNIFVTGSIAKWVIFSSTMVPTFMQLGIAPQFTQFIFRAAESMTNGITPLLAYFVVYLGYMNIYNKDYEKPITIRKGLSIMMPYFIGISLTWLFIILMWYIIGLPLGPGVYPSL